MQLSQMAPSTRALRSPASALPRGLAPAPARSPLLRRRVAVRFKEDDRSESELKKASDKLKSDASNTANALGDKANDLQRGIADEVRKESQEAVTGVGYYAWRAPWYAPVFGRRREVMIGRIAMLGFMATCVLESVSPNHYGPIMQAASTFGTFGTSPADVVRMLGYVVAFNAYALLPFSHTFSPENQQDIAKRPFGPGFPGLNTRLFPIWDLGSNLGISGFGFTKRNELFQGRLAMVAWLWTLWGEVTTGAGPIAQLAHNLGRVADDPWYGDVSRAFYIFIPAILALSYAWGSRLQNSAEKEIY